MIVSAEHQLGINIDRMEVLTCYNYKDWKCISNSSRTGYFLRVQIGNSSKISSVRVGDELFRNTGRPI